MSDGFRLMGVGIFSGYECINKRVGRNDNV